MPFIGRVVAMVSPALNCHAMALTLNVARHVAALTETASHDASSCKVAIRLELDGQSGASLDSKMISSLFFRIYCVPLSLVKWPIETLLSLCLCASLLVTVSSWTCCTCKKCFHWLLIFFHQEKLAKSIHYLISKEDQVRSQITNLEGLINQTEVRQLKKTLVIPTHFTQVSGQLIKAA